MNNQALGGFGYDRTHDMTLERLSEEHGILSLQSVSGADIHVGDRLRLIPNHACTAANLADTLIGVRDGRVEELLPVLVRGGGR